MTTILSVSPLQSQSVSPQMVSTSSNPTAAASPRNNQKWTGASTKDSLATITALHEKLLLEDVPRPAKSENSVGSNTATTPTGFGGTVPVPPSLGQSPLKKDLPSGGSQLTRANIAAVVSIKGKAEGGSSKLSPVEKEFQKAVEELYLEVGGLDYRRIAHESVSALETVLRVFKEGLAIAKNMGPVVSQKEVHKQYEVIQKLLGEAKTFVGDGASLENAIAASSASPAGDVSPADSITAAGGEEMYDVGVLLPQLGRNTRNAAHEDEIQHMKNQLQSTILERNNLRETVDQQEKQLQLLKTKLQKECEALMKQRASMAEQIENLLDRFPLQQGSASSGGRSPGPSPARQPRGPFQTPEASSLPSGATTPTAASKGANPTFVSGESSAPTTTPASAVDTSVASAQGGDTSLMQANTNGGRFNRLESLYADVYNGRGMDLLLACMECVYKREYDDSEGAAGAEGQSGGGSGYQLFKDDFNASITALVESEDKFKESISNTTPLRSVYVANCLSSRVKPNSGVVKLLSSINNDRDVSKLSLKGNYIGDHGITPLLPVLNRLYLVNELDLSDNGMKNTGLHNLSQALQHHPNVTSLNLSRNFLSRAAGKDLLSLVGSNPKIRHVDVSGTDIEKALVERIEARVKLNAAAPPSPQKGKQHQQQEQQQQ